MQGVSEQVEGVAAGRTVLAALQIAHGAGGEAGLLGQLLLGEAGDATIAP